jgi:photosystem II stability/assembly factor-like uncharacterized protein
MNRLSTFLILLLFFGSNVVSAQWERLSEPTIFEGAVGNITCVATNDSMVWVGTEKSGIFRYNNLNPTRWEAINTGVESFSIFSISHSNGNLVATTDRGIYLSTNNGDSWSAINNGLPLGRAITSFTTSNGVLLAATSNYGIFRSTDNGQEWKQSNNGLLDNNILQVQAEGNSVWALSRNAGLFKSVNGGESWDNVLVPNNCLQCSEIAIIDSSIFIAQGSLLVSKNGGKAWTTDNAVRDIKSITSYRGRLIANSDYRLYESADSGKSWLLDFEFNLDSTIKINTSLSSPNDIKYAATNNYGLYRGQIAAVTWKPFNIGLLTADVHQIEWHNGVLYATAFGNVYRSADNGDTWIETDDFFADNVSSFVLSNDRIIVSSDTSGIRSADIQFFVWQDANTGLGNRKVNKVLKRGNTIYALTQDGIYRSPNEGGNWFKQADAIDSLIFTDMLFANNLLYVGTNEGLYKSSNGGNSFEEVDSVNIPRRYVHFIRKINGKLWLKVGIDTHISEDGGATWPRHYYYGGITFANAVSTIQNRLYASTTSGFMFRDTAQEAWHFLKGIDGLQANVFQTNTTHLFAGTGAGIWRMPLSNVVTSTPKTKLQNSVTVYPNPTSTTLNFKSQDLVINSIALHNIKGQQVYFSENTEKVDIQAFENGIYFAKLNTEKGLVTKRIIILK